MVLNIAGFANRIDSRARGNAPQLLEKYRKLAHDAHLNGDRVQAEYYLQFADHYFRVLADARTRQEEQRRPRDERWEGGSDEHDDAGDFNAEGDFPKAPPNYPVIWLVKGKGVVPWGERVQLN